MTNLPTAYSGPKAEHERQMDLQREAERWKASLVNRDPRETERNLRALSYEDKEALRRAGYKGDLSPLPPDENSGRMERKVSSRPSYVETYFGDPNTWMDQFKWPIKLQMLSIRAESEDEDRWQSRRALEEQNFRTYGTKYPAPGARPVNDQARAEQEEERRRLAALGTYTG